MTNQELRDLLEYFGQEQACYTALLDLSRRQRQIIQTGDVDDLLAVLGQKQQVLEKVGDIESQLLPYKQRWRTIRATLDADDRQVLDLALATVEELLAELIALEKESEQALLARREETVRELADATKGQAVNRAYAAGKKEKPARFLDIRSD